MSILTQILAHKKKETAERKSLYPVKLLEQSIFFDTQAVSLKSYLCREDASGIIAEIKRKSPSKGDINPYVNIKRTSIGYMQAGASALSVLTDSHFFGGKNEDLTLARKLNYCPILRKDFILDEYQVVEAKSIGADAILLIASALYPATLKQLAAFAHSIGLEVLMEVHNQTELDSSLNEHVDLVGVNNRDLKTFKTDLNTSVKLAAHVPKEFVKVAESGIKSPSDVVMLKGHGFQGFLIGEYFMQHSRPEEACTQFIEALQKDRAHGHPYVSS